jgi:UDP-N-acetylmuramoylalanine--D-glutamate ligase
LIPITVFAGQQIAVFGLGNSGLLSARALAAGGADVICFDDNIDKVADAEAAGLATLDFHDLDWSKVVALVLTPGVPLTHPAPHWACGARQQSRCRDHRRYRIVLPGASHVRRRLSAGRHHRHQR